MKNGGFYPGLTMKNEGFTMKNAGLTMKNGESTGFCPCEFGRFFKPSSLGNSRRYGISPMFPAPQIRGFTNGMPSSTGE